MHGYYTNFSKKPPKFRSPSFGNNNLPSNSNHKTGNMGNLNNWLSDPLWEKVDSDIFDYMRTHSGSH